LLFSPSALIDTGFSTEPEYETPVPITPDDEETAAVTDAFTLLTA
jgi:hypothetical protein